MQYYLIDDPRPDIPSLLHDLAEADRFLLKFLSANDLGLTAGHQAGIYIARDGWPLFPVQEGESGENFEKEILLEREDGPPVKASFKWYGDKTRNEYRLTRVRELFRNREEACLGALFIILRKDEIYRVWTLKYEEDIDSVLNFLGLSPADVGGLARFDLEERARPHFEAYVARLQGGFPESEELAREAQKAFGNLYPAAREDPIRELDPDRAIITLIQLEFALFRRIERALYGHLLEKKFESIEDLIAVSLQLNNRRKSRAGRSLEYHLRYIFDALGIAYAFNETTEHNKRPDFIFPGIEQYRDPGYDARNLFFLGAKTTCKDRWRQILNEADRIPKKHLFTLQQGFTSAQLQEMKAENVTPVLPLSFHRHCKPEDRENLLSLGGFLKLLANLEENQPRLF